MRAGLAIRKRKPDHFANKVLVALILRMNGNCRVSEHRFRASRGNLDRTASVLERIGDVGEPAVYFLELDFVVA